MKHILITALFAAFISFQLHAQDTTRDIKMLLDNKTFTFRPTTMTPVSGRFRPITDAGYLLQVKGNTLIAYLPYFGRAYQAPVNSADAGINFTSENFNYVVTEGKKESYNVSISTKDRTFNSTFNLTVYKDGTAYLQANSTDKQQISYNGTIVKK